MMLDRNDNLYVMGDQAFGRTGAGYTNLAMLSGVSEMIARALVSLYAVPAFGYIAVCYGDPTAWMAADVFLIPAFVWVYHRLKKMAYSPGSDKTAADCSG